MRNPLLPRLLLCALCLPLAVAGQAANAVTVKAKGPLSARRGETVTAVLDIQVKDKLHINSHQPADRFYIPLKLTWDTAIAEAGETIYPKPIERAFGFSEGKKLSVLEGAFQIQQQLVIKSNVSRGFAAATGALRYQACSDTECYPPTSVPVKVTVDVR